MVKNPLAVQETQVLFLGQEDALEEVMAIHSSILARKIPRTRSLVGYLVHGVTKSWTQLIMHIRRWYLVREKKMST